MSEENLDQENTEIDAGSEPEQNEAPALTAIEQRALEMGWKPRDSFTGDEDDFIDAKEFVRRKPLFDKIEHQSRELRQVRTSVAALKEHYTQVEKAAYDRAIRDLRAQQKTAIQEGDLEKYHEIQEEISTAEKQASRATQIPDPVDNGPDPAFVSWKEKNSWYDNDSELREFADTYGIGLAQRGVPPTEVLAKVEAKVRSTYASKFQNPRRASAPAVEGSTAPRATSRSKGEDYQLTDQERRVMNALVQQGVLTKEKYIADLKKIKGE